ncbi:MAG: hypothetical protein MJZ77_07135 [Bacteroidales bacterium]|nr:hypothetical protein [Bacteroidales bacterium]
MKKVYSIFFVACAVLLTLVSCQKDTVTLRARISTFSSPDKTYMGGPNNRTPLWENGDPVWINGLGGYNVVVNGNSASIPNVPNRGDYYAVYPTDIMANAVLDDGNARIENVSLPAVQNYLEDNSGNQIVKAPMGAWSDNENLEFTNLGALLAIKVTNATMGDNDPATNNLTIDKIEVISASADTRLWGEGNIENANTDSRILVLDYAAAVPAGADPYTLTLDGISSYNISVDYQTPTVEKVFYVYIPATTGTTSNRFKINVYAHSDNAELVYSREQATDRTGNIGLNHCACVPMALKGGANGCEVSRVSSWYPEGSIHSLFSVALGVQVYFSKGNLQYSTINSGTWRFAEHQTDIIDGGNTEASASYTGYIDLFGWGTSGYHDVNDSYSEQRYPYSNTFTLTGRIGSSSPRYQNNYYQYGPSYDNTTGRDLSSHTNYDWGVYNTISNGSDAEWYTLTSAEWEYLTTQRFGGDMDKCFRYCGVIVDDEVCYGIMLFPDNFTTQNELPLATDSEFSPRRDGYDHNDTRLYYTIPEGVVFLPSAGSRYTPSAGEVGEYNKSDLGYWLADVEVSNVTKKSWYARGFNRNAVVNNYDRVMGLSVRLVTRTTSIPTNN